jgi:hypothetical protein
LSARPGGGVNTAHRIGGRGRRNYFNVRSFIFFFFDHGREHFRSGSCR